MRGRRTTDGDTPGSAPPPAADPADRLRAERRAFLKGAAAAGSLGLACGYASLAPPHWPLSLRDADGERGRPRPRTLTLPAGGYAVPADPMAADLGIARGTDPTALVRAAIDAVGGIRRFVARGDIVLIKPNVAFERVAALGATTSPEVLGALIALVLEAGAAEVRVADNPIESPESCFARSGIQKAAVAAGARVFLPAPGEFELLHTPEAKWISEWPFFWRPFRNVTRVIGVAPAKDHNLCRASLTTKNWYGLLGGRRNQFHQDIHGIITDLARMMRPTFVVLDGTRVLYRNGPTGGSFSDVREGHTVAASTDSLAADAFGWDDLLGRAGEERPEYFARIAALGLGNPDWRSLKVREEKVG